MTDRESDEELAPISVGDQFRYDGQLHQIESVSGSESKVKCV